MKKILVILLLLFIFIPVFSSKKIIDKQLIEEQRSPNLVAFTGNFEYFSDNRYNRISILIEKNKLVLLESPEIKTTLDPSINPDGNKIVFIGRKSGKEFKIIFRRNEDGFVNRFKFVSKNAEIYLIRCGGSYLKDHYLPEELKKDFLQFRSLIETIAVKPYAFIDKRSFDDLLNRSVILINHPMTLNEFYRLLLPLKEKIGCGHSHLDYPHEYRTRVQNYMFPFVMTLSEGKCYFERDLKNVLFIPKYSEILEINGVDIKEIIKSIKGDISSDGYNEHFKSAAFGSCFQYYYANRYGTPKKFKIKFKEPESGKVKNIYIQSIKCKSVKYSNNRTGKFEFNLINDKKIAFIRIPSFSYYGGRNKIFFSFIDKAFRSIKDNSINDVVIDMRGNGGGDPYCAAYLLSYIEKKPVPYFTDVYPRYEKLAMPVPIALKNHFSGNLFVLISRSNFSTSGHILSLIKYHELGVLIGGETGSTYTCNGAVKGFDLKNTRIHLKLSSRSYSVADKVYLENRGIIPDHKISASIEDLRSGIDPVMENAFRLISLNAEKVNKNKL